MKLSLPQWPERLYQGNLVSRRVRRKIKVGPIRRQDAIQPFSSASSALKIEALFAVQFALNLQRHLWLCPIGATPVPGLLDRVLVFNGNRAEREAMFKGKLVFAAGNFGDYDIFLYDLCTGTLKQLTSGEAWNDYPRFSPDASKIAFGSTRSGKQEIWMMNADGSDARSLTAGLKWADFPTWSPDGKEIAFVSDRIFPIRYLRAAPGDRQSPPAHEGRQPGLLPGLVAGRKAYRVLPRNAESIRIFIFWTSTRSNRSG